MSSRASPGAADKARVEGPGWYDASHLLRPILETALLLISMRLVEDLFLGTGFYSSLDFHPFWLVVLLASLQYGIYGGVAAAGIAALLMERAPRPIGVDITEYYTELAALPMYWIAAALVIGSYRHVEIRRLRELHDALDLSREMNQELADEIARMDSALAHAELTLATGGSAEPAGRHHEVVFAALRDLLHAPKTRDDLVRAFQRAAAAATALPARLFLRDADGNLIDSQNAESRDRWPHSEGEMTTLVQRIARENGPLVIPRSDIARGSKGYYVAMAIKSESSDEVAGAVVLLCEDETTETAALPIAELLGRTVVDALHRTE